MNKTRVSVPWCVRFTALFDHRLLVIRHRYWYHSLPLMCYVIMIHSWHVSVVHVTTMSFQTTHVYHDNIILHMVPWYLSASNVFIKHDFISGYKREIWPLGCYFRVQAWCWQFCVHGKRRCLPGVTIHPNLKLRVRVNAQPLELFYHNISPFFLNLTHPVISLISDSVIKYGKINTNW